MMTAFTRRTFLAGTASAAALGLSGCVSSGSNGSSGQLIAVAPAPMPYEPVAPLSYAEMYGPIEGDRFPIPAVNLKKIDPAFLRTEIDYDTAEAPGTIIIDPQAHYLYHVGDGGRAMRYGVGVGREGFSWAGAATINSKQEWPDWYPPKEMIERQPELRPRLTELQSGIGMAGGPGNPLGARAMYLWQNNKDTLYRIHGTVEPWTIGKSVSSGCIRMINQDAIHLYNRTPVGTKVVVLGAEVA
jgi:lipoprotein-anchoring transpeptidase ErfK/SrfK